MAIDELVENLCPNCNTLSYFFYVPYLDFGKKIVRGEFYECYKCGTKTTEERLISYQKK